MKQRKTDASRFLDAVSKKTDLIPGVPLLEIAGQCRVLLENHQGIIAYSPSQITVRVQFGTYSIRGCALKIEKMRKDQLVIHGKIDAVQLIRGC